MKRKVRIWSLVATVLLPWCHASGAGDRLTPSATDSVHLEGWLGNKLELALDNRVMAQDVDRIVKPFQTRIEQNNNHWRCEYWGKWFTSAVLGCGYEPTPEHYAVIDRGVSQLLATQSPDGYIGTYRADKHLLGWDVWGRKYSLLGLIADYDLSGNRAALAAAVRVADQLIAEAPPGKFNLTATGLNLVKGLPASSILEPIALLYQRTGEQRYLNFANDIVACWSKPNAFVPHGLQLEDHALEGVPPAAFESTKAYEMMSCFAGLCELYRATGDHRHLESALRFAQSVSRTEIMVHGSGSNQELWCDGTRMQTELLEQPVETCVTVSWMELCDQLLRLTGDPHWADEMEISLYNALLGAMTPQGNWWAYFSPLEGQRVPSHYQQADMQLSCCVANGPRGLLLTPKWAVMGCPEGVIVNLYAPGNARQRLPDGSEVKLVQRTDYPYRDKIILTVSPVKKTHFTLKLRIPVWSKRTSLSVNGAPMPCAAGRYAEIARDWSPGDQVELQLDLRGRAIPAPSGAPQFAVMRGPILLAMDNRLTKPQDDAVRLVTDSNGFVPLRAAASKPGEIWMAYEVPFEVRPTHFFKHHRIMLAMCDYSSAGNRWGSDNLFRVWLPQPLYLRGLYPADTWKLMTSGARDCPAIPEATSTASRIAASGAMPSAPKL